VASTTTGGFNYNRWLQLHTTPGFVVTVDYIHFFTSGLVLLSCQHPDSGCQSVLGYSVFQTLPSLFPPPLSPPTNYQTEGSGARLVHGLSQLMKGKSVSGFYESI